MHTYIAVSSKHITVGSLQSCALWAQSLINNQKARNVKIFKTRPDSVNARIIFDISHDGIIPIRNGRIVLSVTQAQTRLRVSESTARRAFHDLMDRGLIERSLDADWANGKAREWRLTYEPYQGREPTDDWQDYKPKIEMTP